jgi:tetratricopeptide (TPR) repeat protein
MNRTASTAIALGVLALSSAAPFAGAQQVTGVTPPPPSTTVVIHGDKARKPHTWFRAESQHFVVYSNTRHSDVAALLSKLERFWFTLREFAQVDRNPPADTPKQTLYYVDDEHALAAVDPEEPDYAIGLYTSCEDDSQGFGVHMYYGEDPRVPLEKRPENEGLSYIFQAYARDFFYRHSSERAPLWFIDGYAQYFGTTRFDGDQAVVGMAPEALGKLLQRLGAGYLYSLDYADVLVGNDSDAHNEAGAAGVRNEFEARSWVLTHWILSSRENLAKFQTYVAATRTGEDRVKAFQRVFGLTPSQLNHALWLYLRKLQAVKMTFKSLPEADIDFTDLPDSADALLLDQAALKSCPGTKYGQTILTRVRANAPKFPDSALAQLTLARAEIEYGDPHAALPWLEKTTRETPADGEAQFLLGRALLAIAQKAPGDAQASAYGKAIRALAKAAEDDPKSPAVAYWFYRASVLSSHKIDDDAAGAAVMAYQEAPQVDAYAYHAGLVFAHLGRRDEALAAMRTVADNPRPSIWAPLARRWLGKLDGGAWDADLLAAAQDADPVAPKGGFDGQADWTYASADVLQALDQAVANQAAADSGVPAADNPSSVDPQPGQ